MSISASDVKILREESGVSIGKCKEALEAADGDMEKAREVLKELQVKAAAKKADRELGAGTVFSYIHANKQMGTILLLACETDFVAKNEEFTALGNDIAMHITAMGTETLEELKEQPFVKDPEMTINQRIESGIQKLGERIEVTSFNRIAVES